MDVTGRDGDGGTQDCRRDVKSFVCSDGDGGAKFLKMKLRACFWVHFVISVTELL